MEGIGSLQDPLFPYVGLYFEEIFYVDCFKNDQVYPEVSHKIFGPEMRNINDTSFCNDSLLSIFRSVKTNSPLKIYPQPASSFINIILPLDITGTIIINNSWGQVVYKQDFKQQSKLVISRNECLTSGIYFYHILDNKTGASYTGKLLFE
jgi:hypothetical protein